MACSAEYWAGDLDHVTEVNGEIFAELDGRPCPRCNCRETRLIESDADGDDDVACLPLRVCVACTEVFGFDDSTSVPDHLLSHAQAPFGGGIWNDVEEETADYPRQPSPCFRDADWSSSPNDDEAMDRDHVEHHAEFDQVCRGRGRGGRRGCGHGRGSRHHQGEERSHHHQHHPQHHHHHHHHQHHGGGRGMRGRGGGGGNGSRGDVQTSSNGGDPWQQVVATCAQSSKCLFGAASNVAAGNYDGAVAVVSDEMEPVGRAVGSAVGSVTGGLIGSPRAGEIGAQLGSTVGRGVAEMLKDSSLCNRSASSRQD